MSPRASVADDDYTSLSLFDTMRCESKLAYLLYRAGHLIHSLSVIKELLDLISSPEQVFILYQQEILTVIEALRATLVGAEVVPYAWASCPTALANHKTSYMNLLTVLQQHESCVDHSLRKRLRVLLMPLTSTLTIMESHHVGAQAPPRMQFRSPSVFSDASSSTSSSSYPTTSNDAADDEDDERTEMPPPSAFDDPVKVSSRHRPSRKPRPRRLWNSYELPPNILRDHTSRPILRRKRKYARDENQENGATEYTAPYRPPRQRFGIFMTGKSSMHNRSGC